MSTPEHAGFLLAMGLQGHLKHGLKKPDVLLYLDAGHNLTTMSILLGEAATFRGSMDLATRKMLCLHIPSLLPHTISEYDHAPCVQNAAVIGIGLLYQGTVHRLMAEFLIGEGEWTRSVLFHLFHLFHLCTRSVLFHLFHLFHLCTRSFCSICFICSICSICSS